MPLGQESFMSAHLQAPSTKTANGLAVEVEGQRLWLTKRNKSKHCTDNTE